MAVLSNGHGISPQFILGATGGADTGTPMVGAVAGGQAVVIDGTPVRVIVLTFAAAAGLVALRLAGFRFSVGVSA